MTTLVWFRDDLRLEDHPALMAAADDPAGIIALFLLDEVSEGVRPLGGAAKWWLHHSLRALAQSLADRGVSLVLRAGAAEDVIPAIAQEWQVDRVVWNRRYGAAREHDAAIKSTLRERGIEANSYLGDLLFEPWTVASQEGTPYRVYSAFWRACNSGRAPAEPLPVPAGLTGATGSLEGDTLEAWQLLPTRPDWSAGLQRRWTPGEAAALEALDLFLDERVSRYARRDIPSEDTGSELSPHLRWGEISPRTVWHRALPASGDVGLFLSELGWREFAKHTAFHFGPLHQHQLNRKFDGFAWRTDPDDAFDAWKHGRTGFGIIDAGMRELWDTGFMHNRVRMITASLLAKNLQLDWRIGEAWFWDTLVDADEASNAFNWQWVAGCGADAAPYFRIFNPELQQKKFDPEGRYVNRWAPDSVTIPPIIDLKATRVEALAAYHALGN